MLVLQHPETFHSWFTWNGWASACELNVQLLYDRMSGLGGSGLPFIVSGEWRKRAMISLTDWLSNSQHQISKTCSHTFSTFHNNHHYMWEVCPLKYRSITKSKWMELIFKWNHCSQLTLYIALHCTTEKWNNRFFPINMSIQLTVDLHNRQFDGE